MKAQSYTKVIFKTLEKSKKRKPRKLHSTKHKRTRNKSSKPLVKVLSYQSQPVLTFRKSEIQLLRYFFIAKNARLTAAGIKAADEKKKKNQNHNNNMIQLRLTPAVGSWAARHRR